MTTTLGNTVIHAVISRSAYTSLGNSASADTLYFVSDTNGVELYKGTSRVGSGFQVLASNPSSTTGMMEGVLYLAPNGKMYYRSGNTLAIAFNLVQTAELTESSNTLLVPSVSAMYSAIATKIAAAMTGTYRSSILAPVADVTALKAKTGMQDKDVVFIESLNALFSYDAQSEVTANDTTVVTPTAGTGRWLKTQAGFTYSSSDFQWGANGLELKGTPPLVVDSLPTASASTVDKLYVLKSDNKMYLGVESGTTGGDTANVTMVFPDAPDDDYLPDYEGGEWTYVSGTGDSRKWSKTDHEGAATLNLLYSNGAWTVDVSPQGSMYATAASGTNPWDPGLVWKYNDGTEHTLSSSNYVANAGASVSYGFIAIAGGSSEGASSTLVNTVASNPSVSASNNGETYFNTATGRTYVVSSGELVQKTYSKEDVDSLVAWNTIS